MRLWPQRLRDVRCQRWLLLLQVLQEAKGRLRNEILDRLDAAKKAGDHASVLRFTRLYAPLGLQVCPSAQRSRPMRAQAAPSFLYRHPTAAAADKAHQQGCCLISVRLCKKVL